MIDSYLEEGFILNKKIGVGQPKRIENAKILVANTAMDTDKVKIYGARVKVDSMAKVRNHAASYLGFLLWACSFCVSLVDDSFDSCLAPYF